MQPHNMHARIVYCFMSYCAVTWQMQSKEIARQSKEIAAEQGDGVVAEQGDGVAFVVGEKFSSYDELKAKVSTYEKSKCVQLCCSDSRTLDAARKRVPRKVENAKKDLVYYRINLSCVFGGKKYQSKDGGKRPHQR